MDGQVPDRQSLELQKAPSVGQAFLRTAHAHVGAWVLAVGVVFALVARRNPAAGRWPGIGRVPRL